MPIRAALEELDALRTVVKPFARLNGTSGRIPTERLPLADWHALAKAAAMTPNVMLCGTAKGNLPAGEYEYRESGNPCTAWIPGRATLARNDGACVTEKGNAQ